MQALLFSVEEIDFLNTLGKAKQIFQEETLKSMNETTFLSLKG